MIEQPDARSELRAVQLQLLRTLATAADAGALRESARTELGDDLCAYLRARHPANVRTVLARTFPVTARALALSDADIRQHFTFLPGMSRPQAQIEAAYSGMRAAIGVREPAPVLDDLLCFERATSIARSRGPAPLDQILSDIDAHTLTLTDPHPYMDLGSTQLTCVTSNAPELFLRHDPLEAQPQRAKRQIAHAFRAGWAGPRWFEFASLRQLRILIAMSL